MYLKQFIGSLMVMAMGTVFFACGPSVSTTGNNAKEFFLITAGASWQYTHPDYGELYEVWSRGSETVNGEEVYVFEWKFATSQELAVDETAGNELVFMETYWQKTDDGVFFRGAAPVAGAHDDTAWDDIFYENPLLFAGVNIRPDETEQTFIEGDTWTYTYVEMLDELVTNGGAFQNVMHISFLDESGTSPFGGDYYLAKSTGIVQFEVAAHPDEVWTLQKFEN